MDKHQKKIVKGSLCFTTKPITPLRSETYPVNTLCVVETVLENGRYFTVNVKGTKTSIIGVHAEELRLIKPWEQYWGSDAPYDVAQDLEETYETDTGKSCVLWTADKEIGETPSDDLATRPEEFSTHGYTDEFEEWGKRVCTEAIEAGCADANAVEEYVMKHHGKKGG